MARWPYLLQLCTTLFLVGFGCGVYYIVFGWFWLVLVVVCTTLFLVGFGCGIYYNVFVWCPCMAINVSVQYNVGFLFGVYNSIMSASLPDIILC